MKPLFVSRVDRSSPDDDSGAVTLQSEQGELIAFSFPLNVEVGTSVPNRLHVLDGNIEAASFADGSDDHRTETGVEKLERTGPFSYRGIGRVVDRPEGLVQVLGFVLDFGEVPCDGFVEFQTVRFDV